MSTATLAMPSKKSVNYAADPHLDSRVKVFLKELNKGTPLETMKPVDARQVLVNAQASAKVDLTGIEVSDKIITVDAKYGNFVVDPAFFTRLVYADV